MLSAKYQPFCPGFNFSDVLNLSLSLKPETCWTWNILHNPNQYHVLWRHKSCCLLWPISQKAYNLIIPTSGRLLKKYSAVPL